MRFISCASYYGTGSSAVTDLLSEYEGVTSFTNFEFRFLQDPDGISDLEFHLVQNHNRHNSGHALKRYKRLVDFYCGTRFARKYEAFFHGKWKECSYAYIDALTDFKFRGSWMYDFYDRGVGYYYRKMLPSKLLRMTLWKNQPARQLKSLQKEWTLCSAPGEEKFLRETRKYIENLFSSVCPEGNVALVDQLLPPSNIPRYLRYFEDMRVVVVDRDPRDVWTLEKYVWRSGPIPHEDVETFCKWFRYTRAHRQRENMDTKNILLIQFEDLIFHYEETVARIEAWAGFTPEQHTHRFTRLIPDQSVKNTQTWLRIPGVPAEDILYIEKALPEYLYRDFPKA